MPPRQRLNNPWATTAQINFLNSRAQAYQDTIDDEFGRKRFWANLREEWLSRWDMSDRQNNRLSSHFRDQMRKRGALPKRVRQPKKAARPPLAATTRHQVQEADKPESTQASSHAVEELLLRSISPPSSHSPTPGPSCVPRSPTPAESPTHVQLPSPILVHSPLAVHVQSPSPALSYCDLPTPSHASPTPQSPSARPSPVPLERRPGAVAVLPPLSIWAKEVSKCLAFELKLPGIEHQDDIELVIQGQHLALYARNKNNGPAYKWTTTVGGRVKPGHVHCGLEDGVVRILIKVMTLEKITDERHVFGVDDTPPW